MPAMLKQILGAGIKADHGLDQAPMRRAAAGCSIFDSSPSDQRLGRKGNLKAPAGPKASSEKCTLDLDVVLTKGGLGKIVGLQKKQFLFLQGDPADSVIYIQKGRVKLIVNSKAGKQATIAVLGAGEFLGEECVTSSHRFRISSAVAMMKCTVLRINREEMLRLLHEERTLSAALIAHLLVRNNRMQQDLVDQLVSPSEKRLARTLLLLAGLDTSDKAEAAVPKVSQEELAEMVGTTRSRVSFFMNRFRDLGYVEYSGDLTVRKSLLNVILGRVAQVSAPESPSGCPRPTAVNHTSGCSRRAGFARLGAAKSTHPTQKTSYHVLPAKNGMPKAAA